MFRYIDLVDKDELCYVNVEKGSGTEYILNFHLDDTWVTYKTSHWNNVINKNNFKIAQGWKIHITTTMMEAQSVLNSVAAFLIPLEISFKFVVSREELWKKNGKQGSRAASGKFITIYPQTEEMFIYLLDELKKITDGYQKGPYILNDCCWKESNVFFRYGGFILKEKMIEGNRVPVIQNEKGDYIEDRREPYYYLPDFVEEPEYVRVNNTFPSSELFDELKKLNIQEALHFSNSGGIYKFTSKNKDYILKEGRSNAGLDATGKDGFSRLKKEYKTLKKLSFIDNVVDVYKYFEIWGNNYFIEEYASGMTLKEFTATNYPLLIKKDISKYLKQVLWISEKLYTTISEIHATNIGVGDLSTTNVMVLFDKEIMDLKLIDLEAAVNTKEKYLTNIVTPGFFVKNIFSVFEADWISYIRIIRYLLLPVNMVSDFIKDSVTLQNKIIIDKFGEPVKGLLDKLQIIEKEKIHSAYELPYMINEDHQLSLDGDMSNIDLVLDELVGGLEKYTGIGEKSLLMKNYPVVNDIWDKYNISHGVFGSLLILCRINRKPHVELSKVVGEIDKLISTDSFKLGLMDGLGGIISTLLELGYDEIAEKYIAMYTFEKLEDNKVDLSFESGLSGIGMLFLGLYKKEKNRCYYDLVTKIKEIILEELSNIDYSQNIGLFKGISGPLLFLSLLDKDEVEVEVINNIVSSILKFVSPSFESDVSGPLMENENENFMKLVPYLKDGSVGISLVLRNVEKNFNLSHDIHIEVVEKIKNLANTAKVSHSFDGGLFEGYLSFILSEGINKENESYFKKMLGNLGLYLVKKDNLRLLTGKYGIRCSLDMGTGTAGAIATLMGGKRKNWGYWIPIPKYKQFFNY